MRIRLSAIRVLTAVVASSVWVLASAETDMAGFRRGPVGPSQVVVHSALGGFILGYDIDQTGTEGLLSEALTLPDGRADVAVETFDQKTGAIVKVIKQLSDSKSDFVTLGIFGKHVGLVEFEHVSKLYVDKRVYSLLDPVDANSFTGRWTPPFGGPDDIITAGAASQSSAKTAMLGFKNRGGDFSSYVFSSNVGANTFGPVIRVQDSIFDWNNSPVMAYNGSTNEAVLASSLGCFGCPTEIGQINLATGQQTSFPGLGFGFVNGIAIDSETRIVCTTTEDDFSVEFYDLAQGTSTIVVLPGATSQAQSGGAVAVDPIHKLFLIGQTFSSTAAGGSSIQVFDEQGNFVESLNGFHLPASPAFMALNPKRRIGYVIVAPDLNTLQKFSY